MDMHAQIEDLEVNIDELSTALSPLLTTPLTTTTSTLPLLDKAKLYVLLCYTIESLLFSSLQASGQNARDHPIFAELARLKAYFQKIKDAELGPAPKTRIDKDAVNRFVKHGLSGNDRYDAERAERSKGAMRKAKGKHTKFEDGTTAKGKKGKKTNEPSSSGNEEPLSTTAAVDPKKRQTAMDLDAESPSPNPEPTTEAQNEEESTPHTSNSTKPHRKPHRTAEQKAAAKEARHAERRERKQQRRMKAILAGEASQEQILPAQNEGVGSAVAASGSGNEKGRSEMFNQLLEGTLQGSRSSGGNGKGKRSRKEKGT
ncbi:hypothetical protein B0J11DRAFT_238933 [Dendryphion nanum]|uniref:Exosome complex protein n=1 Tax=Dendryphion nanum TaxID=256645 RepID=A0A9P9CXU5_9PLEO|nr:hypothetical protein B0J11DRAFT_238933 [Dendryphion nanum]